MKVLVGYVPIVSEKGVPLLSQNRQFQWFNRPTYIYPMVPASAATLAAADGHDVRWIDAIAERLTEEQFLKQYREFDADLFLLETKTPVIKATWRMVRRLKEQSPRTRIAVCGDHVTALPAETLDNSPVDYILRGGDYDVLLRDLLRALDRRTDLPAGLTVRDGSAARSTGDVRLDTPLDSLPLIDRELTKWQLYSRENGNFRDIPGTYTMAGRDCWWGKCRFCSWTTLYSNWRVRSPEHVLDEIGVLLDRYPLREIFDDTGCFPGGAWLRTFCRGVVERGYHRRVTFGCNMIPGVLSQEHYDAMAAANFRFVLFGLESADQGTLDRLHKCGAAKNLEASLHMARAAGLRPHVTCMVGYPWETREQARGTIALARKLFDRGDIQTLQATIVIPYPGTPLFRECQEQGWLKTEDWDRYDMREPIMKTEMSDDEVMALTRGLYSSFLTPRFIARQLASIRSWRDVRYYARAGLRVAGHLLDFARQR
jgi:radical SAM superfamily enzyme YgiQ (UPF0313 family)